MVSFVVVAVEGFFANCEGRLDHQRVLVIDGGCDKMFVDVAHGWYDSGNAGCSLGKEQCHILEDLTM